MYVFIFLTSMRKQKTNKTKQKNPNAFGYRGLRATCQSPVSFNIPADMQVVQAFRAEIAIVLIELCCILYTQVTWVVMEKATDANTEQP